MTATSFDMSPMEMDITRARGDTFPFILNLKKSDGTVFGDITGSSFILSVDRLEDPPDENNQLFQIDGTIVDAVNAQIKFTPSANDADQIPDTYYFDVQMKDPASALRTAVKGQWIVMQDITKDT